MSFSILIFRIKPLHIRRQRIQIVIHNLKLELPTFIFLLANMVETSTTTSGLLFDCVFSCMSTTTICDELSKHQPVKRVNSFYL